MNRFFKAILLLLILIILLAPMMQRLLKLFPDNYVLHGYFVQTKDTTLSYTNWFSGIFQTAKEKGVNERFGFRNLLVRLNNQINFSVYKEFNVVNVFKGKNDYLFSSDFFNSYSGIGYKGNRYADSVFTGLQNLNDFLISKNKKLLICFTPCKESFYPEFLPDSCLPQIKKENYYSSYKQKIISSHIPFLDYNNYYQKIKVTSPYSLFTQGAVHWTRYGAYKALDTLLKRVSFEINKKINLFRFKSFLLSDSAMYFDDDISRAMNLLKKVNSEKLAYPEVEYIYPMDSCYKPKVLIIGDSFFYGLNNTWIPLAFFSKESYFLYYFRQALSYDNDKKEIPVSDLNISRELENTDIVILFFSIGTLNGFPYGATSMINK